MRLILRTAAWRGRHRDDLGRPSEKQYEVQIDPRRLVKYGLSFKEVMERLAANNKQVGGQFHEHRRPSSTWCAAWAW